MNIVISVASTKKKLPRNIVIKIINESKWNTKKYSNNPKQSRKGGQRNEKGGTNRRCNYMAD